MPNLKPVKLAIFDLDGTLIDSLDDLTDATNHMRAVMGRTPLTLPEVRELVGQGARRLVERALPGADNASIDRALDLFLEFNSSHIAVKTALYPQVRETLDQIKGQGMRLAVVSNKNEDLCRKVLQSLGADSYFDDIMGADTVSARKPSPEPLLKLLRDYQVVPSEAVIVGDSINDILAGKNAGVATVGCTYGYGGPDELEEADYIVDKFQQLLDLPLFASCK